MLKTTVLQYFNNRVTDVAEACNVSVQAVSQWGALIPEKNALKLDRNTKVKLKYDASLYSKASETNAA